MIMKESYSEFVDSFLYRSASGSFLPPSSGGSRYTYMVNRERDTEREGERQRETEREGQRQRERQRERDRDRERQTEREGERERVKEWQGET